jgi:hypothetical protein
MANFLFSPIAHCEKLDGREVTVMLSKQDFDTLRASKRAARKRNGGK